MANFLSVLLGPHFADTFPAVFMLVLICCILFTYLIMKLRHIDTSLNNHITDTNKKIDHLREDVIRTIDQQREDFNNMLKQTNQRIDQQREDFNAQFKQQREDFKAIFLDIYKKIDQQREDFNAKFDQQREDFNAKFDQQREDFNAKFDQQREDFKDFKQELTTLIKNQSR